MKLLISTLLILLLLGFAGDSYGQNFEETKGNRQQVLVVFSL